VAEVKKSTDKPAEPVEVKLGRASESGDAGVQFLLAKRSIHASNGDTEKLTAIDAELAALGLTAQ
jgi:hypothetical protein